MQALYKSPDETCRINVLDEYQENENTVFIKGKIKDDLAFETIASLKYLSRKDTEKPITLMINSQGGTISAGLMIYDYIKESIPNPIYTVGIGMCASMGSFLLTCCGEKRSVYPNTFIMYHQPLTTGISGDVNDVCIYTNHLKENQRRINRLLSKHCSLSEEEIKTMFDRDCFLSPEECIKFSLIDNIISKHK